MTPALLHPRWSAPIGIGAAVTLRHPGVSLAPYTGLNLAYHTGDDAACVIENRTALLNRLGLEDVQWLEQVHGAHVLEASVDSCANAPQADGAVTSAAGLACAVMVADCLPVLLATRNGNRVGALHVGWRGLLAGVLESGLKRMEIAARDLVAWLGPCISGEAYEVGPEVRHAYLDALGGAAVGSAFSPSPRRSHHWLMDLRAIAAHKLTALGVTHHVSPRCAYREHKRFYSYRRDGVTGRFAALVWITPNGKGQIS